VNKDLFQKVKLRAEWRARRWAVPLVIGACCFALELGGDAGRAWGRYDRAALEAGEVWRVVTAHLVHLGWGHLWPNLLALLLICALLEEFLSSVEWLFTCLAAAVAIAIGLYVFDPGVQWYVGLSGVLHGLVACGAVRMLQEERLGIGAALALGVAAKLTWEATRGPIPFTEQSAGGPVIVAAHLYGAIAGTLTGLACGIVRRRFTPIIARRS
jgi:rhomboid family GlyGly-CTERM serine protease